MHPSHRQFADTALNYMKQNNSPQKNAALELLTCSQESKLITHLNACVHCGLCATSCMYFTALNEEKYIPANKVDLVASIYRRYCTTTGKIFPLLTKARELDEEMILEMIDSLFGGCTLCGRCVKHCSIGVDIPFVIRTGRRMISAMERVPASLEATINSALETGNNMGIPTEEFVDTLQWMEEELQEELEDNNACIPLDQKDKDILYTLNPREPKFFPLSISAMAKIFYAANERWTLSTKMYDITNYAYFSGNNEQAALIATRLADEMRALSCKKLILGECGHGSRAIRWEAPNYLKKSFDFEMETVIEYLGRLIRTNRIQIDRSINTKIYTIHDPCNISRHGGLMEELRFVVKTCVNQVVEMNPHGNDAYCCGGGGGALAMSEYNERRLKIGKLKAEQIRKTGAQVVITPCHNCVDQLTQLNHTYKLGIQIKTLAELIADALVIK